jgi:hypothetical protein
LKDTKNTIENQTANAISNQTKKPIWRHTEKARFYCQLDNTSCNKLTGAVVLLIKSSYAPLYYDEWITKKFTIASLVFGASTMTIKHHNMIQTCTQPNTTNMSNKTRMSVHTS